MVHAHLADSLADGAYTMIGMFATQLFAGRADTRVVMFPAQLLADRADTRNIVIAAQPLADRTDAMTVVVAPKLKLAHRQKLSTGIKFQHELRKGKQQTVGLRPVAGMRRRSLICRALEPRTLLAQTINGVDPPKL